MAGRGLPAPHSGKAGPQAYTSGTGGGTHVRKDRFFAGARHENLDMIVMAEADEIVKIRSGERDAQHLRRQPCNAADHQHAPLDIVADALDPVAIFGGFGSGSYRHRGFLRSEPGARDADMPRRSQPGSGSISALVDVNAYVPPRQAMRDMSPCLTVARRLGKDKT